MRPTRSLSVKLPSQSDLLSCAPLPDGQPEALSPISPVDEDVLLLSERERKPFGAALRRQQHAWLFKWGLFVWAAVATIVSIALIVVIAATPVKQWVPTWRAVEERNQHSIPTSKRNVIFMVSDGMGPTSLTMTRNYVASFGGSPQSPFGPTNPLRIDTHLIGTSRTRSTSSLVTDSAAGATAFSCGLKSYNGAISVLPDGKPCGTVLEAAKLAGYTTGLVVTTRITDATPAAFAAHVPRRSQEDRIASHLLGDGHPLGRSVDLMLGGGSCHFLPNTTHHSCRADDRDMFAYAHIDAGFSVIRDLPSLRSLDLKSALPLIGLFATHDIPYEIDRLHETDKYPSLAEMAETALKMLSYATKDSDKGFFIMIEGSRVDHAGHDNDPAAQVREVMAYDDAMAAVVKFIDSSDVPTVMVSTSDHETGGLDAARQVDPADPEYFWYPSVLANVSHSAYHTAAQITRASVGASADQIRAIARSHLAHSLSVIDPTDAELDELVTTVQKPTVSRAVTHVLSEIVSVRAHIGWSTHGHSAVDVNIYAYPPQLARPLYGNHENTDIGRFLASFLDVDVAAVTEKLQKANDAEVKDPSGVPLWMAGGEGIEVQKRRVCDYSREHWHNHFGQDAIKYQADY